MCREIPARHDPARRSPDRGRAGRPGAEPEWPSSWSAAGTCRLALAAEAGAAAGGGDGRAGGPVSARHTAGGPIPPRADPGQPAGGSAAPRLPRPDSAPPARDLPGATGSADTLAFAYRLLPSRSAVAGNRRIRGGPGTERVMRLDGWWSVTLRPGAGDSGHDRRDPLTHRRRQVRPSRDDDVDVSARVRCAAFRAAHIGGSRFRSHYNRRV